ncbi:O-methyltransferase [Aspergillus leporis]|uniref:catechol O-methyltransferase n=1 Tax=Aspergillus leporis TaxID=41062 RepID=A0A5N5X2E2_9EURO|nr:O-methyltransferase [Aspergillus leporis]
MGPAALFYKPEEGVFCNDGREDQLLAFVTSQTDIRGSPEAVLAAIDEYGRTQNFLMNVGEEKGKIITGIIFDQNLKSMLEIGGYIGYSAILFGSALRRAGGQEYISLEMNPKFAAIARTLVAFAGLNDVLCEELELVAPGTIVVADDMYLPGNPPYSEYMRASPILKTEASRPSIHCLKDGHISLGNPALVYETSIHEGLQPTGLPDAVEVSYCVKSVVN